MSATTIRRPPEFEPELETTASRLQQTIEAMADVAQGRIIAGEVVHEWLRSWGSADELPALRLVPGAGHRREQ